MATNPYSSHGSLSAYRDVALDSSVGQADPHRLIGLLLDGALERIGRARVALAHGDRSSWAEPLHRAVEIVGELGACVDVAQGGPVAANLEALYDYAARELLAANAHGDVRRLENAARVLQEIRGGWSAIGG